MKESKSKIVTLRRQEAARRNGAKSRGPVTPEGKAKSSRNAVKHGCLATLLTFNAEEADVFNRIQAEYEARLEPRDQMEHDLVAQIVRANWQMRQAWAYQSSILGLQIALDAEKVNREWKSIAEQDRRALAYKSLIKEDTTIANLQRYSRSLALEAERALKMLLEFKKLPLPPAEEPDTNPVESAERNEPNEVSKRPNPMPEAAEPAARAVNEYAITTAQPRIPSGSGADDRFLSSAHDHANAPRPDRSSMRSPQ